MLSIKERTELVKQGTRAALNKVGAFSCPVIDDDLRFAAWIEGYELGELRLAAPKTHMGAVEEAEGFWAEVSTITQ